MPLTKERIALLKEDVFTAFADVPRPGEGDITQCDCDECRDVQKTFAEIDWKTASPKVVEENFDKLPLFSPEGLHYFLPAYLLYSLDHFKNDGVCEYTLYHLTPGKETESSVAYYRARFAPFTPEQMNIVYEFLDLARQDETFAYHHTSIERGKKRLEKYVNREADL